MLAYLFVITALGVSHAAPELREVQHVDQFGSPPTPDARFAELTEFMSHARRGGSLRLAWNEAIPSVYPSAIRGGDFKPRAPNVDGFVYETLMTADPRFEPHTVFPLVAKSVRASADFCQFEIELRDDVRFSDGSPLTTADVRRSTDAFFNEYFSGAMTELTKTLFGEFHLDVLDERRFRVRFERLVPTRCRQGAYYVLGGIPLVKENPRPNFADSVTMPFLGSGPYRVAAASRAVIKLERNPDYWAEGHPLRARTFNPAAIETRVYQDPTMERFALFRGEVNVMREKAFTMDEWMANQATGRHPFRRADQRTDAVGSAVGAVWFNQRNVHTGNRDFRRALVLAWDVRQAAHDFFADRRFALAEPGAQSELRPRGEPTPAVRALLAEAGADDPEVRDALRPADQLEYARLSRPTSRRQRLRLALAWLRHAGYELTRVGHETRLTKEGLPVELTAVSLLGSPEARLFLRYRAELGYLGIKLHLRAYPDRPTLVAALQANQYDLYPQELEMARDFHVLNSNYLTWQLHSRNRDRLGAWGRVNSKALDVSLARLENGVPGTPEYRTTVDALVRAIEANVPVLLSGEVDPVVTYHATDVHVWRNREFDLTTLYIEN